MIRDRSWFNIADQTRIIKFTNVHEANKSCSPLFSIDDLDDRLTRLQRDTRMKRTGVKASDRDKKSIEKEKKNKRDREGEGSNTYTRAKIYTHIYMGGLDRRIAAGIVKERV